MTPLTPSEKEKIMSRLFWDGKAPTTVAEALIQSHLETIENAQSQQFFRKLLTSCDWYTLLKLVPAEKLLLVLDDNIINGLFPRDLKTRYQYARDVLSR
jgi:hypothetical protein